MNWFSNWLQQQGDDYVTANIDDLMLDPTQRRSILQAGVGQEQPDWTWGDYASPKKWFQSWYAKRPESQQHFSSTLQKRLMDEQFRNKLFGGSSSLLSSGYNTVTRGGATGFFPGAWNYSTISSEAKDPRTWYNAFVGGDEQSKSFLQGATHLNSAFGKQASALDTRDHTDAMVRAILPERQTIDPRLEQLRNIFRLYQMGKIDQAAGGISDLTEAPRGVDPQYAENVYKTAAWLGSTPHRSVYHTQTPDVIRMPTPHFSTSTGVKRVLHEPNLSPAHKGQIISSIGTAARGERLTGVDKFVAAGLGAGMGYTGATIAGKLLSLPRRSARVFSIGSAILGGYLNSRGK